MNVATCEAAQRHPFQLPLPHVHIYKLNRSCGQIKRKRTKIIMRNRKQNYNEDKGKRVFYIVQTEPRHPSEPTSAVNSKFKFNRPKCSTDRNEDAK